MFDLGYFKLPFFFASCLLVGATLLVAQCLHYWQFLVCQGLAIGVRMSRNAALSFGYLSMRQLGCGIIFGPAMGVISHWFKKHRGIALGLTASGSSIGGT